MGEITFTFLAESETPINSSNDLFLVVNEIKRGIMPENSEITQDIPGKIGNVYAGLNIGARSFQLECTVKADTEAERVERMHTIANLIMATCSDEQAIIFDDEPDTTYYGHFHDTADVDRLATGQTYGKFTLMFTCSDPKGYKAQITQEITDLPFTFTPITDADTYPILTLVAGEELQTVAVTDQDDEYIFLGSTVDDETGDATTITNTEPLILNDPCNTLANWTSLTSSTIDFDLENGTVGGKLRSTPNTIRQGLASDGKHFDFGEGTKGKWHGGVAKQMLTTSCENWRVRVRFQVKAEYKRARSKIELYLLDTNGMRMGKIMLKDNNESGVVYAQLEIGTSSKHKEIYYGTNVTHHASATKKVSVKVKDKKVKIPATKKKKAYTKMEWRTVTLDEDLKTNTFTNFYGFLELEKRGNKFHSHIMKLDENGNPVWKKGVNADFVDTKNNYQAQQLGGVACYIAKMDIYEDKKNVSYQNTVAAMTDLKVWKINDVVTPAEQAQRPIAYKGDEILLNSEEHNTYKNNDLFMKKLHIGSTFISLKPGEEKTLLVSPPPDDDNKWYITYRPTTM